MPIAVANRYARALADVVGPGGDYRGVLDQLRDFAAVHRESGELRQGFHSPAIPLQEKRKLLDAILARLGTTSPASNFLRVLLEHYRLPIIDEVVQLFQKIANDRLGIVQVKVFSAAPLSEPERRALEECFRQLTHRQVELELDINRDLLGGIQARIESTVYDGSIRGQLERVRQSLMAR